MASYPYFEMHPHGAVIVRLFELTLTGDGSQKMRGTIVLPEQTGVRSDSITIEFLKDTTLTIKSVEFHPRQELTTLVLRDEDIVQGVLHRKYETGHRVRVVIDTVDGRLEVSQPDRITTTTSAPPTIAVVCSTRPEQRSTEMLKVPVLVRYVVDGIDAKVQHTLHLDESAKEPAELSTLLYAKIGQEIYTDKRFEDEVTVLYNPAPYRSPARDYQGAPREYLESVSRPSPSVELQQRTWSLGPRRISNDVFLPMKSCQVDGVDLEYSIVYSQFPKPMSSTALHPSIEIRGPELPLFNGDLQILSKDGHYLTGGDLRVTSSGARAELQPLYYGVFLSTEVELKKLTAGMIEYFVTLKFESSRESSTRVKLQYPSDTRISTPTFTDYFMCENQLREYIVPKGVYAINETVRCYKINQ